MKKYIGYLLIIFVIVLHVFMLLVVYNIMRTTTGNHAYILIWLSLVLYILAFIYRLGKKLSRPTFEQYLRNDTRKIILWLRSFKDDNLKIRNPKASFSFFSLDSHFKSIWGATYEEEIAYILFKLGPIISIDTKEKKTLGATKEIVNEINWKEVVIERAKESRLILILLNSSKSLLWEINELPKYTSKDKFIYLLPSYTIHEKVNFKNSWNQIQKEVPFFNFYSYDDLKNKKIIGFYFKNTQLVELKIEKLTDKYYLRKIDDIISNLRTEKDILIEETKNNSKKARVNMGRFWIWILFSAGHMIAIFAWIFFFISIPYAYKTFKAPKDIKKMFLVDIWIGRLLYILVLLFFGFSILIMISHFN